MTTAKAKRTPLVRDPMTRADRKGLGAAELDIVIYGRKHCYVLRDRTTVKYLCKEPRPSKFRWCKDIKAAARFRCRRDAASVARALAGDTGDEVALMERICLPGPSAESVVYPPQRWFAKWYRDQNDHRPPEEELGI